MGKSLSKQVLLVCLSLGLYGASPSFGGLNYPLNPDDRAGIETLPVSFWGRPYPWGFQYSRSNPCVRYVRTTTRHGWRWQKVWICD